MTWVLVAFAAGAVARLLWGLEVRELPPPQVPTMDLREAYPVPGWERPRPKRPEGCTDPDCPHEHYTTGGFGTRICLPIAPRMIASEARRYLGIQ